MATTRIIPMHINKGKTIAQCLLAAIALNLKRMVKALDKTNEYYIPPLFYRLISPLNLFFTVVV